MASETEIERLLFAASIGWESAINSLKREDGLPVEFVGVPENPYRKRLHALRLATGTVAA